MRKLLLTGAEVVAGDHIFLEDCLLCRVEGVSKEGLITFWVLNGAWQGTLNVNTGKVKVGSQELSYPNEVWYKVFPSEWDVEDQYNWYYVR